MFLLRNFGYPDYHKPWDLIGNYCRKCSLCAINQQGSDYYCSEWPKVNDKGVCTLFKERKTYDEKGHYVPMPEFNYMKYGKYLYDKG